jgi:hypothetical protein
MKPQNRAAVVHASSSELTRAANLDALANEMFARLGTAGGDDALKDFQLSLARATEQLARPANVVDGAVQDILRALPPSQLEALILHLNGMPHAQIAQRQGKTDQALLKDLASTYARMRFSLGSTHASDSE